MLASCQAKANIQKEKEIEPSNYRLVPLLQVICKIIGKVIHDQSNAFLLDEKILYNYHSHFRVNHSTDLCLPFFNR